MKNYNLYYYFQINEVMLISTSYYFHWKQLYSHATHKYAYLTDDINCCRIYQLAQVAGRGNVFTWNDHGQARVVGVRPCKTNSHNLKGDSLHDQIVPLKAVENCLSRTTAA